MIDLPNTKIKYLSVIVRIFKYFIHLYECYKIFQRLRVYVYKVGI